MTRPNSIKNSPLDEFSISELRAISEVIHRMDSVRETRRSLVDVCNAVDLLLGKSPSQKEQTSSTTYRTFDKFVGLFKLELYFGITRKPHKNDAVEGKPKSGDGTSSTDPPKLSSNEQEALVRHLIKHIDSAVTHLTEIEPRPTRVQIFIGVSQSLTPYFVPEVVRKFQSDWDHRYGLHDHARQTFEIIVEQALPQELIKHAQGGAIKYDLVVTSCEKEKVPKVKFRVAGRSIETHTVDLPMFLLIDRRSSLASLPESEIDWNDFKDTTILIQDFNRDPVPEYPPALFMPQMRVQRQQSYLETYATCLGAGPVAGIGFPQVLDSYQRARLKAIRPEKLQLGKTTVTLIPCDRRDDYGPAEEIRQVIGELYKRLREALDSAATYDSDLPGGAIRDERLSGELNRTYSFGQSENGNREWSEGILEHVAVTPDGYLNADHVVKFGGEQNKDKWWHFSITGRISRQLGNGPFHIVWRGRERFSEPSIENYAVSIIARDPKEMLHGPLYGIWLGRSTRVNEYQPDLGFFVIVSRNFDWISNRAHVEAVCMKRLGHLQLGVGKTTGTEERRSTGMRPSAKKSSSPKK